MNGIEPAFALLLFLVVLQVLDVATTIYAIERCNARESNKLVLWLMQHLGLLTGLLVVKLVMLVAVVLATVQGTKFAPVTTNEALFLLDAFYVVIVMKNCFVIDKA